MTIDFHFLLRRAFTLIELMVVIAIIGTTGSDPSPSTTRSISVTQFSVSRLEDGAI